MKEVYTEKQRQTDFLFFVLSGFGLLYCFAGISNLATQGRPFLGTIEIVMGASYLFLYYRTRHSDTITFASWFLVLSMFIFFILFFCQNKGNHYSIALSFFVPVMVFILFPRKTGLFLYVVYSIAVLSIFIFHAYKEKYSPLSSHILNIFVAFLATGGILYYYEIIKSDALESLKKISELLSAQKEKLENNYKRSKVKETILTNLIEEKTRAVFQEKTLLENNYKRSKAKETILTNLIEEKSRELYQEKTLLERNYKRTVVKESTLTRFIEDKSREIYHEKEKSEKLLLNILPQSIVEELKQNEEVKPQHYDAATIMFTDFVGFTKIAESTIPVKLVKNLDYCFSQFDKIAEKLKIEKIKTIGDSYMCAGGLPVANNTHPVDACLAALRMMSFIQLWNQIREKNNLPRWDMRMGINTGSCMAGIIGKKKFAYDVWGDAVNIASRMESSGVAGEINISEATKILVDPFFITEPRGFVSTKSKGEMAMFLLRGIRPELSKNDKGTSPNDKFVKHYLDRKNYRSLAI